MKKKLLLFSVFVIVGAVNNLAASEQEGELLEKQISLVTGWMKFNHKERNHSICSKLIDEKPIDLTMYSNDPSAVARGIIAWRNKGSVSSVEKSLCDVCKEKIQGIIDKKITSLPANTAPSISNVESENGEEDSESGSEDDSSIPDLSSVSEEESEGELEENDNENLELNKSNALRRFSGVASGSLRKIDLELLQKRDEFVGEINESSSSDSDAEGVSLLNENPIVTKEEFDCSRCFRALIDTFCKKRKD